MILVMLSALAQTMHLSTTRMGAIKTDISPSAPAGQKISPKDLKSLERARAIFSSLFKYINAKTIYAANNPTVSKFANAFFQSFRTYFQHEKELLLSIEQYKIKWNGEVIYENTNKIESIAFLLYKDGVGELMVQPTIKPAELDRLADLLKNEIYNPSSHLDIVSKLWEADFSSIFYRVYDECADATSGEGQGSGTESKEKPLQADDHRNLPVKEAREDRINSPQDNSLVSLGTYLYKVIEQKYPGTTPEEKEQHIQGILECLFTISIEEFAPWQEEFCQQNNRDKLLWLLNIMLDFTQANYSPATVRDILDIIDRLVRFIIEEANIPTLIALLHIQKKMASVHSFTMDFQALPGRLEHELTNTAFLIMLGRITNRSRTNVQEVLQYFQFVGGHAVPGVCELLATLTDPSLHKEACDTLLAIAENDIVGIVETLNLDNPHEARDAVYLLRRAGTAGLPPVIRKLLSSPDIQVRQHLIDYLAEIKNEEAAQMLLTLLEDRNMSIRIKTLAAIEDFRNPSIVDKVSAMCFSENLDDKHPDELERLFRTVGKLAGETVLGPIKAMINKKTWVPFGKSAGKQHKLLAITALRYIPGEPARNLLKELAGSRDKLVRTKAHYMLKLENDRDESDVEQMVPAGCEVAE